MFSRIRLNPSGSFAPLKALKTAENAARAIAPSAIEAKIPGISVIAYLRVRNTTHAA
jgi:hypothetical protein